MRYDKSQEDISVWEDTNELCFEEVSTSSSLGSVLQERGSRYGEFIYNATVSQELKEILHKSSNWETMPPDMKEALHMIVHKISRLVEGDFNYDDSWIDISGYSTLIVERLHLTLKQRQEDQEFTHLASMQNSGIVSPLRQAPEKKHL